MRELGEEGRTAWGAWVYFELSSVYTFSKIYQETFAFVNYLVTYLDISRATMSALRMFNEN